MAVPGHLPRVVPADREVFVVDGKVVPPGTVVGMSTYTMHNSEELWGADARSFNPDRWLGENAKSLDSYFVPFSKALCNCLGQNLAFMEATLVIAMLYRTFDLTLSTESMNALYTTDNFTSQVNEPGIAIYAKVLKE